MAEIKVGDKVCVSDSGKLYARYADFVNHNVNKREELYKYRLGFGEEGSIPLDYFEGKEFTVIAVAKHEYEGIMLAYITDNEHGFVLGVAGLSLVNPPESEDDKAERNCNERFETVRNDIRCNCFTREQIISLLDDIDLAYSDVHVEQIRQSDIIKENAMELGVIKEDDVDADWFYENKDSEVYDVVCKWMSQADASSVIDAIKDNY